MPDNYTESVCTFDCECMKAPNSPASFECSESCECDPYNNTCIQQFNSSQACCSDKTICGKYDHFEKQPGEYIFELSQQFNLLEFSDRAEIEKLKKCYLEGRSYHLGAQMHPITDSYTCLCTEDFDNATSYSENSNCAKIDCEAVTISFARSLWDECAPVFVEPICCADTFKCRKFVGNLMLSIHLCFIIFGLLFSDYYFFFFIANKNDKIDSKSRSIEESDGSICKFGNLTLRRGEELEPEHTKYYDNLCKCEMPPILTCLRRYYN